ncbi:hypothetical protein [Mycobacterium montefiorense]|nr:hypothetical protein [Mycobacterium montefiorense]GKU51200.1 hypothetical protein NJB14195_24460 [Mycobacterium montefiorense]
MAGLLHELFGPMIFLVEFFLAELVHQVSSVAEKGVDMAGKALSNIKRSIVESWADGRLLSYRDTC